MVSCAFFFSLNLCFRPCLLFFPSLSFSSSHFHPSLCFNFLFTVFRRVSPFLLSHSLIPLPSVTPSLFSQISSSLRLSLIFPVSECLFFPLSLSLMRPISPVCHSMPLSHPLLQSFCLSHSLYLVPCSLSIVFSS